MADRRHPRQTALEPTNPVVLSPALLRTPIAGPYLVAAPWARWLQASWGRQGGAQAPSNAQLADGVQDNSAHIGQVEDDLGSTSSDLAALAAEVTALQTAYLATVADLEALTTRVTTLEGRVTTLEGRVTTLEGQVTALETTSTAQDARVAALEAWKSAVVAGLPAVVAVVTVPALGNDPATAILLENDLTANWRPPINTNDTALQTAVNAVRNALAA